jgi:hypothetical protein
MNITLAFHPSAKPPVSKRLLYRNELEANGDDCIRLPPQMAMTAISSGDKRLLRHRPV